MIRFGCEEFHPEINATDPISRQNQGSSRNAHYFAHVFLNEFTRTMDDESPATHMQTEALKRFGMNPEDFSTKQEASDMLEKLVKAPI